MTESTAQNAGSDETIAEQQRVDARIRSIRFADSVRIAGEAVVFTLEIRGAETSAEARAAEETEVQMCREADRVIKEYSLGYRADDFKWERDGLLNTLTVSVHGTVTTDERSPAVHSISRAGGERWVRSIEYLQELLREHLGKTLKAATNNEKLRVRPSWRPGAGVLVSGGGIGTAENLNRLEEELWDRTNQEKILRRRQRKNFRAFLILTFVVTLVAILISRLEVNDVAFLVVWVVGSYLVAFALLVGSRSLSVWSEQRDLRKEMQDLSDRIELADYPENERRAYRLFKLNGRELQRYYDQALRQRSLVFVLGVACILAGFASIAWALMAIAELGDDAVAINEKIIVAVLGGTGAILADFIAVIFLRMFSSIVKASVDFHLRLVGTHHAHFGNVLASGISDETAAAKAKRDIAVVLVGRPSDIQL